MARIIDATGGAQPQQNRITVEAQGQESIALPHPDYIANADILRDGQDLILRHPDGSTFVVEGYFSGMTSPLLTADNGAALTPAMVKSFVQPADAAQYAQAESMTDASAIGRVSEVTGKATIIRADGTAETAAPGVPVYEGDIVETDASGAVNIIFADETSFAVSSNARLSIDEYVFDPVAGTGSTNFSVLRGMFVFVSGLIGREDPDDVEIHTPIGSIGIRGTTIAGNADTGEITVLEGAIVLRGIQGGAEMTLAAQFETARFNAASGTIEHLGVQSGDTVSDRFMTLHTVVPALFAAMPHTPGEAPVAPAAQETPQHTAPAEPQSPPPGGYNETSFDGGHDAGFAAISAPPAADGGLSFAVPAPTPAPQPAPVTPPAASAPPAITGDGTPLPPPVNNNTAPPTTSNGGGNGTTNPGAIVDIDITGTGAYTGGTGNDSFRILAAPFGTIDGGAGYDRIVVDASAAGLPPVSGGMIRGIEEIDAANGTTNSLNFVYDASMTATSDNRHLLISLDASDTLSMNFQNMGFRMVDMGADYVTIANGTDTVRIETPNLSQINLSGLQAMQVGTVMSDGSIFAGYGPTNEMLFLSTSTGSALSWNDGGASFTTVPGGTINGASNTAQLMITDSNGGTAGQQAHIAAAYTDGLVAHGHSDWHLPSLAELALLFQNGLGGTGTYWSSNQSSTTQAWAIDFATGAQLQDNKALNHEILAVRTTMGPNLDNILLGGPTGDTMNMTMPTAHVSLRDGNDTLNLMTSDIAGSYFDGGAGQDRLVLQAGGTLDLSMLGTTGLNNFEEIDFGGSAAQTIRLSIDQIFRLMKQANLDTLTITDNGAGAATLVVTGGPDANLDADGPSTDSGGFNMYEYTVGANVYTLMIADTVAVTTTI